MNKFEIIDSILNTNISYDTIINGQVCQILFDNDISVTFELFYPKYKIIVKVYEQNNLVEIYHFHSALQEEYAYFNKLLLFIDNKRNVKLSDICQKLQQKESVKAADICRKLKQRGGNNIEPLK